MKHSTRVLVNESKNAQKAWERNQKIQNEIAAAKTRFYSDKAIANNNAKRSILSSFGITSQDANGFWAVIEDKAPKLLIKEYILPLRIIAAIPHCRPILNWKPNGKGRDTLFNSLCNYLLAKYQTPQFLWSVFFEPGIKQLDNLKTIEWDDSKNIWGYNAWYLIKALVTISRGGSFAKLCKSGEFPITLNNRQCHQFLQSSSNITFVKALRQVQIRTYGGDNRLLHILMLRRKESSLLSLTEENFLDTVIAWFAKNPMLDLDQLDPLMDFIWHRWNQDRSFAMKGRSAIALINLMQEWHTDLSKQKILKGKEYKPSGLKYGLYKNDNTNIVYEIVEILNSKELQTEGRYHKHCVLSYSYSVEMGRCSIWSMRKNSERVITIEVSGNCVVQARGRFNRSTTSEEFQIIKQWAQDNSLGLRII